MNIKNLYIFIVALFFSMNLCAQTLSPSVLASGGGSTANGGVQLNWTLGQPFGTTAIGNKVILTQGFEQPELQVWTGNINMPNWGTCAVAIPYTVSGVIDPNNIFTAELSDANGNFAKAVLLGTKKSKINGSINGVIPQNVAAGTGYRIRVRSSIPQFTGMDNGTNLVIRKVSIPDAFAYKKGVLANTIYPGWSPASSLTLAADANGAQNASYAWRNSNGKVVGTGPTYKVTSPGTYTVTLSSNGCSSSASKTITQIDVSCGSKKIPGVMICQKMGNQYQPNCVSSSTVANYLNSGSLLGACPSSSITATVVTIETKQKVQAGIFSLRAFPNPTTSQFTVQLQSDNAKDKISVRVINLSGQVVETISNLRAQQVIRLGTKYRPGMYVIEMMQGENRTQVKVVKQPD